jgi:hypothetical protein|tara:strand:+ start:1139 stop:1396 length:258 start_codon:yes stop_codon:yes gene_type:complete
MSTYDSDTTTTNESQLKDEKFLETQEQKDRLQQNVALIRMEEGLILKQVLKLEHWLKFGFILTSLLFLLLISGVVLLGLGILPTK